MKKWKLYTITSVIFLILTFIFWIFQFAINKNIDEKSGLAFDLAKHWKLFTSNAFEVSGLFSIASGVIYWTSSEGAFDAISYTTKQVFSTLFRKVKYPYSYSEYKLIKHPADEQIYIWHLIIVGIVLVGIGLIFSSII